jgi:[amino group carrier protein]-lysine/ornithine hydrolase
MHPETLLGLVEHYSASGQESAAVAWLVGRMATLGYTQAFVDEAGNAVGVIGSGSRQIVLLGHIDTVPGEIPLRLEGDLLYGRGSVDAKGPLACFVDAAARLRPYEGWQILVVGAVDEERDSLGARAIAPRYHPEAVIVGEPNGWERIALGYKGSAWARLSFRVEQTHTASGQPGACEVAVGYWLSLQAWAESFNGGRQRLFDRLLITLRGMDSGEDGFEQWARLRIGARLPLDLPPQTWYDTLIGMTPSAQVEPLGHAVPAYQCEKNTPLVRAFLASIRSQGGSPSFVYKTGTADLNIVAPVWNCPALVYGPGDSSLDHTPNEHLSITEFHKSVDILETALRGLLD